jgi:hypothetical protein
MKTLFNRFTMIFLLQLFLTGMLTANTVQYISPLPNSKYNSESTNIIIGYTGILNQSIVNTTEIKVIGTTSGIHTGKIILAEKNTKIIFKPDKPFAFGEKVTVSGVKNIEKFSFYIRDQKIFVPDDYYLETSLTNKVKSSPFNKDFLVQPDTMPAFTIYNSGTTANGYIFISNFPWNYFHSITMILNNNGTPFYARTQPYQAYDFKKQNDNLITFYEEGRHYFIGLNTSYDIVDSFYCGNGLSTDLHELRVMSDGSAWLLSYDAETVDMSLLVAGGKANAVVTGLIVQKINHDKTVTFQWRSWDYFSVTDATHEDLTAYNIDYVHGNAIEIENDGNILISSRHLDEITKINSSTGDIIWRLGGKNNQFTFLNDSIKFSHQHCVRKLDNENIILFDNGNYHSPSFSRAVEYKVDEDNMIVNLVWQYRHTPEIYAAAMGSVQRLSNGNTLIGWGSASTTLTEVTPDGNIVYELSLPSGQMSYRAFRDEWGVTTSGYQNLDATPSKYVLYQNYPNPFNPSTNIKYQILKNSYVTLKIYDILGKELATLVNEFQKAGTYEKQFSINSNSLSSLPSGIYFYRLQAGDFADVKKMILVK